MTPPPDPAPLIQLITGYWPSAALFAACQCRLFDAFAKEPLSLDGLQRASGLSERGLTQVMPTLLSLGLVELTEGQYSLTPLAQTYLVSSSPASLLSGIEWSHRQMPAWERLSESLRSGNPAVPQGDMLGGDPAATEAFVSAMRQRALGPARGVVPRLPLQGCASLLDVGGGPGAYAALIAQSNPAITVTVLDLPPIVECARPWIDRQGLAERVQFVPGDATNGDYGIGQYDAVLLSGVLHRMSPETCRRMIVGAARAANPGGRVMVVDLMLNEFGTGPLFPALFSLQMLLITEEGAVFSVADCQQWMTEAGLDRVEAMDLGPALPYWVVSGVKG